MPRLTIWLTGLAVTLAMALLLITAPPFVATLRNAVFDSYQRAAPRSRDPAAPVHVVDIDEASLRELGQWPWPRTFVAELTDRLFAAGAIAVGFDILFSEPDRTSPDAVLRNIQRFPRGTAALPADIAGQNNDDNLAAALIGRPVILALAGAPTGDVPPPKAGISYTGARPDSAVTSYPGALAPLSTLSDAAAGLGVISLGAASDGISRGVPMVARLGDQLMPSLAAELLRVAQGARSHILRTSEASGEVSGGTARVVAMRTGGAEYPLDGNGELRLHFTDEVEGRMTPAHLLLNDETLPAQQPAIAGRIILVGSSAQGLFDLRRTPLSASVPGVLLQADVLEQVLAQTFLTRPDWMPGLELVLLVLAGLTVTFLCTKDKPMAALIGLAVVTLAAAVGGWQTFAQAGLLFDPALIVITGFATLLPGSALGLIGKERMRAKIRSRFAYFVPGTLVDEIAADPGQALTPKGASREMTVMFVDMRRFSTVTEKMSPEDVVRLLNRYLGAVSDAMVEHGATIDKYIGDAIMAFWNAPLTQEDHRALSLATIFAIEKHVAEANAMLEAEGLPSVGIGLGINTGQAFVGLMGSRDRLSYTCVGDSVTQAARFEGLTRLYGTINCVGADTVTALPPDMRSVMLDRVVVKGRMTPVALHTVYRAENAAFDAAARTFEEARNAYLAREWDASAALLDELATLTVSGFETDTLAKLYGERIAVLRDVDLPADWDGTFVADSKRG